MVVDDCAFIISFFYFISDWQVILVGFLFLFSFLLHSFLSFNIRLTPTATPRFGSNDPFRIEDRLLGRDGNRFFLDVHILYFTLLASFLTETLNSANKKK